MVQEFASAIFEALGQASIKLAALFQGSSCGSAELSGILHENPAQNQLRREGISINHDADDGRGPGGFWQW